MLPLGTRAAGCIRWDWAELVIESGAGPKDWMTAQGTNGVVSHLELSGGGNEVAE